jgi:probable HAF family extracellular repeat protein
LFSFADIAQAGIGYTVTDLGGAVNGIPIHAVTGINSSGQVIGDTSAIYLVFIGGSPANELVNRAFLYDGTMHDLGTLGGGTWANGISDNGDVIGESEITNGGTSHAFVYSRARGIRDLNSLIPPQSGWTLSNAEFVDSTGGQIIGSGSIGGQGQWFQYGNGAVSVHDFGTTMIGGNYIQVSAINSNGQYVGTSQQPPIHAVLYDGTVHDLGSYFGSRGSSASGINASGEVIGQSDHAFLYDGEMHDLGTLPGKNESIALGINAGGQVVGYSYPNPYSEYPPDRAFLYTVGSGMVDLNSLIDPASGWELTEADVTNDAGQIAGLGVIGGEQHAFLLTPVPEPISVALAAMGFASLTAWHCRVKLRLPIAAWKASNSLPK